MSRMIIKRPVITEKTMQLVSEGRYSFEVLLDANKKEIAESVQSQFDVKVVSVRTLVRAGKVKRILKSKKTIQRPSRKFAVISLKDGQKIEGFEKLLEVDEN